jgi:hypothetical protein
MSIKNKNKDNLKDHSGVELVVPAIAPTSEDPLRFWTCHPTENVLVDLHVFANGESKNPSPTGGSQWLGAFSGRPEFIAELTSAIQARLTLASSATCRAFMIALRKFWRMCDELESTMTTGGRTTDRLTSVRDLGYLHEAAMHRTKFERQHFCIIQSLSNETRRLLKLRPLRWTTPKLGDPIRVLIPDSHAKALKIGIKRDWQRVRETWERNDAIRRGREPDTLSEYEKQDPTIVQEYAQHNATLRKNLVHFERIQTTSGKLIPTGDELYDGHCPATIRKRGLSLLLMRAIPFPTMEEAHIAYHAALMRSGWNPSTLIAGIDANLPNRIFQHPKNEKQSVLAIESGETETGSEDETLEEFNMQGSKCRAGGRMQFCLGLKKDPDSPPNIVATYLERTRELRAKLHQDVKEAQAAYERLEAQNAPRKEVEGQFKRLQTLQQGTRNVWLYVDRWGGINWIDGRGWAAFRLNLLTKSDERISYIEIVTIKLNDQRKARGEEPIAVVTPSDFRDIYARWVYLQSGGNILAVMVALGHARLQSTDHYVTNNIFSEENDEAVRRFMSHLFDELTIGRLDLTILAQLVRHGALTDEMLARLTEYRSLTRSRIKVACADVRNPPNTVDPEHIEGKRCGTHRCLKECPQARFLPESLDGIAMRVEELIVISDHTSIDTWIKGGFDKELEAGEYLLNELYPQDEVEQARTRWREVIFTGKHVVPGVGLVHQQEAE